MTCPAGMLAAFRLKIALAGIGWRGFAGDVVADKLDQDATQSENAKATFKRPEIMMCQIRDLATDSSRSVL